MEPTKYYLFDIAEPEHYSCYIQSYSIGHSELTVNVTHHVQRDNQFFIVFGHVFGFIGTMRWNGVYLRKGTKSEFLAVMRELLHKGTELQSISDEQISNTYPYDELYIFEGEHGQIKIISDRPEKVEFLRRNV